MTLFTCVILYLGVTLNLFQGLKRTSVIPRKAIPLEELDSESID